MTDTPEWKDLYLVYYLTSGAKVNAGSEKAQAAIKDKKYSYAVMKKPKDLTDKQWEEVSKAINKKPLRVEEVYDEDAGEFRYDFINFDTAYTKLIEILYSDPYKMEKVIEQFQTSYAKAMWNLPDKNLYNFAKDQCELGAGKEYFKEEFTAAGDLLRPDKDDKKEMIEEMVSFVRARTAEQLEDAIDKALSNTFSQITFSINRVEHLLNTKLVFHVEDRNLLPGETFADSIYCVDWRSIKENEPYLPSNNKDHSGGYDDPELITPMRFVMEDSSPLFKPLQGVKGEDGKVVTQKIPYTEYYPYVPDFLPQAKKGQRDDVVYTCTLYHYLMMGAPKQMLFKNCGNPKEYVDQEGVLADIEFPEITEETVVADVKIKVSTGNDIGELEGMWGPARNGTKYENKDRGQVAFIVENGGKSNTFTSSLSTQEECYFMEDGRPENSRFIYKREPKKDGEVQKGTLTIWKPNSYPEEKLVFTVEEVEKDVIFLKEWNFYLERFSMPKGTYSLKCKTDHFLSSSIEIPNASLSIRENDTLILEIPAVSASYSDSDTYTDGETRNSTHELTRDKITIKAKLTNMADIPYGYDDAVGKTFTVTDITPTVTATNKVKDVFTKKNGSQETNLKQYTYKLEKFSIAKGEEEYPFSSNVIVYFDCKKKDQVRFIQMNLVCEKTETSKNERESDKAKTYGPSEFTYYSQWDNR